MTLRLVFFSFNFETRLTVLDEEVVLIRNLYIVIICSLFIITAYHKDHEIRLKMNTCLEIPYLFKKKKRSSVLDSVSNLSNNSLCVFKVFAERTAHFPNLRKWYGLKSQMSTNISTFE